MENVDMFVERNILNPFIGKTVVGYELTNLCRDPDGLILIFDDGSKLILEGVMDIGEGALSICSEGVAK